MRVALITAVGISVFLTVCISAAAPTEALVYNVTNYSVTPDDMTNDHTGINTAIGDAEAAGGGVVYFPPGQYLIGGSLTIDSPNVTLRGEGAELKAASSGIDIIVVTETNDVVIENLRITGTGTTDMSGYPGTGTAIDVRQSSFVRIRNNDIHFMTGTGIIVTGKRDTNYSATATHDVWVQNNFLEYCNQGITIFSGAKHVFVDANKIEHARTWSIGVDDRSVYDTTANACENIEITNNIVKNSGMTSGSSQTAIAVVASKYCSVIGNQVIDAGRGVSPVATVTAIGLTSGQSNNIAQNNIVANNLIVRPVRGGIFLGAADYNSIQGNTLVDVGTDGTGATSAIKLAKAAIDGNDNYGSSYNRISENVVIRTGSADTDYGVRIDDSYCQHNTIMNETYRGVTSSAISDAGTNTVSWRVLNDNVDVAANREIAVSASLNFATALTAQTCETLTVSTVTGAADGDLVVLGLPNAIAGANTNQTFDAWASGTNTVKVRRCNAGTGMLSAASGTAKIGIVKR